MRVHNRTNSTVNIGADTHQVNKYQTYRNFSIIVIGLVLRLNLFTCNVHPNTCTTDNNADVQKKILLVLTYTANGISDGEDLGLALPVVPMSGTKSRDSAAQSKPWLCDSITLEFLASLSSINRQTSTETYTNNDDHHLLQWFSIHIYSGYVF